MSKDQQQTFFDATYAQDVRAPLDAFYTFSSASLDRYHSILEDYAPGKRILEIGCGVGSNALFMAQQGADTVIGIDISPAGIEHSQHIFAAAGLNNGVFAVMDAEALQFEDNSFDLVVGTGVLHHLDLPVALAEICRVLEKDGAIVFVEPLGYNPAINLFRSLTPQYRVEDEYPFKRKALDLIRQHFAEVHLEYFYLLALLAAPFRRLPGYSRLLYWLSAVDSFLFHRIPGVSLLAWQVLIRASRPIQC